MKIAYWSPLSPMGTGVADYSEELLPYLARGADIHLFVDGYTPSESKITELFPWHPASDFEEVARREQFDLNLYQLGNSHYHRYALNAALRFPGIVVLHDLVLQHLFLGLSVERANVELYISEMKRAYGERGAALGRQIAQALGSDLLVSKFPLCERVVERSYGVLVLTYFMQRWLRRRFGSMPVGKFIGKAPHHYAPPPPLPTEDPLEARKILDLPQNGFLVSSFGLVSRAKRIEQAIEGFRLFARDRSEAKFLVVGEVQKGFPMEAYAGNDLGKKILVTGRQTMDRFYLYMLASDVVLNLRFPSTGELSGTLIRTLGMGKAVLVSNTGPFVEFPEYAVARIDLGPPEVMEIAATLELLAKRPELRRAMGHFARAHVEETYGLQAEASAYLAFLEQVLEGLRSGKVTAPPPFEQADLAASIAATISDLPLGGTFGLETVREALRSATEEGFDYPPYQM